MESHPPLSCRCLAEALGTFILVFFGCGVVHAKVLTGAQTGLWQVAIVWGVAIMIAVYVVGAISGAHINPAITIALACWGRCSPKLVVPYIVSQLAGAMAAAGVLFVLFGPWLEARETALQLQRGKPGSEMTAMCYGEYFPNPAGLEPGWKNQLAKVKDADGFSEFEKAWPELVEKQHALISEGAAMLAETLGTLLLALAVFALTDPRNREAPAARLAPVFIGLTVAILISVIDPLTQACFNPARDFGPRLVAYFAGWGEIALPGPRPTGFFTVYIVAPILGAVLGGALYTRVLQHAMPEPERSPTT
jgi:glycerol uptake facilitator protein